MLKTVLLVNHYIYGNVIVKMIYFFLHSISDLLFLHGINDLLFLHGISIRTIGFLPAIENFFTHKDRILTLL